MAVFLRSCAKERIRISTSHDAHVSILSSSIDDCSRNVFTHRIDKVHRLVCGHNVYTDIKIFLIRIRCWNDIAKIYFVEAVEKFRGSGYTLLLRVQGWFYLCC